jgi:hypothetical protein
MPANSSHYPASEFFSGERSWLKRRSSKIHSPTSADHVDTFKVFFDEML